jgi:hypothetical protein
MRLVGQDDLQARSAYQPVIHRQGDRWIAYVGHHGGSRLNALTGRLELNGTSIVDVSDPQAAEPFTPTEENLLYPQIGRLDMSPDWGGHTAFPVLGVQVPDWTGNSSGRVRDFVLLVSESLRNECREARQLSFMVDVTDPSKPFSVSTFEVPESPGRFCSRGGHFGPHASNESFTPIYYGRLVFIAYFNGGVRAVDVRDPFSPREAGFYIPAVTARTDKRCVNVNGAARCKVAIQINNVEVDDEGTSTSWTAPTRACTSSSSRAPRAPSPLSPARGTEPACGERFQRPLPRYFLMSLAHWSRSGSTPSRPSGGSLRMARVMPAAA